MRLALVCRETPTIVPRRINVESYFVIRAFDRQAACPIRPGNDQFLGVYLHLTTHRPALEMSLHSKRVSVIVKLRNNVKVREICCP